MNTHEGYSRIPRRTVLHAPDLTPCEKLVYAELADHCWQGNVAKVGGRAVAKNLCISATTVYAALLRLAELGRIVPLERGKKRLNWYVLASDVFGKKQGAVDESAKAPSGGRRLVSAAKKATA